MNLSNENKNISDTIELQSVSVNAASSVLSEITGKKAIINNPDIRIINCNDLDSYITNDSLCIKVIYNNSPKGNVLIIIKKTDAICILSSLINTDNYTADDIFKDEVCQNLASNIAKQTSEAYLKKISENVHNECSVSDAYIIEDIKDIFFENYDRVCSVTFDFSFDTITESSITIFLSAEMTNAVIKNEKNKDTKIDEIHHPSETLMPKRLDILKNIMDKKVRLTVEIGKTRKTAKEILDFSKGTIVELDKPDNAPADIMIGDIVIAHGEIVVIDDSFAVRVTEILNPDLAELILNQK